MNSFELHKDFETKQSLPQLCRPSPTKRSLHFHLITASPRVLAVVSDAVHRIGHWVALSLLKAAVCHWLEERKTVWNALIPELWHSLAICPWMPQAQLHVVSNPNQAIVQSVLVEIVCLPSSWGQDNLNGAEEVVLEVHACADHGVEVGGSLQLLDLVFAVSGLTTSNELEDDLSVFHVTCVSGMMTGTCIEKCRRRQACFCPADHFPPKSWVGVHDAYLFSRCQAEVSQAQARTLCQNFLHDAQT
mmetsp:Transcript_104821/g.291940  ORF Transcript_104821/g.291940 Transcript_104821/m.291940 type:complete len:246 (+) Transcript_104821:126-863(+)